MSVLRRKALMMAPDDLKLGRISELKDSPFADESPLELALADLKQRKGIGGSVKPT